MNNDITINVRNRDAGNQYIMLFQKPTNINEMYDTLFPAAWKVLPLASGSQAGVVYPVSLQIMVKEYTASFDAKNRGTTRDTELGQLWKFRNEGAFNVLETVSGQTVDGLMACMNSAPQRVDISLGKAGSPLVIKRGVPQGDQANFKLTPTLYVAYVADVEEGELIKSDVSSSKVFEVDLTNLRSIDLELQLLDKDTGKKGWVASNIKKAS